VVISSAIKLEKEKKGSKSDKSIKADKDFWSKPQGPSVWKVW
jgi:hypothetical protein